MVRKKSTPMEAFHNAVDYCEEMGFAVATDVTPRCNDGCTCRDCAAGVQMKYDAYAYIPARFLGRLMAEIEDGMIKQDGCFLRAKVRACDEYEDGEVCVSFSFLKPLLPCNTVEGFSERLKAMSEEEVPF